MNHVSLCTATFTCGVVCAGVADGVGAWSKKNVCPGVFARRLMECASRAAGVVRKGPRAASSCLRLAHTGVEGLQVSPPMSTCITIMTTIILIIM